MLAGAAALAGAIALAMLVPDQALIMLGDGQLNQLHATGALSTGMMSVLVAPIGLLLALGIYWLQRLFSEYQQGRFFTDGNMRCYVWLVWLKVAGFVYGIAWPLIIMGQSTGGASADVAVNIDAGTLIELVVLLLIVHVLREAQQLHDENQAFI